MEGQLCFAVAHSKDSQKPRGLSTPGVLIRARGRWDGARQGVGRKVPMLQKGQADRFHVVPF